MEAWSAWKWKVRSGSAEILNVALWNLQVKFFFLSALGVHRCAAFAPRRVHLQYRVPCRDSTRNLSYGMQTGANQWATHTPPVSNTTLLIWDTPHPFIEFCHTTQWAMPHPSIEVSPNPPMGYATPLQWVTPHPSIQLCQPLHWMTPHPSNELHHTNSMRPTPHPSNELRHTPPMSYATPL